MTLFSSLRSRIILTSAVLAVLSIGAAIYVVNVRVTRQAESALQREIVATGALVDQLLEAGGGDEVVVDAVDFAGPRRPRRGRDAELQVGDPLAQAPDHRGLADRGGTGQHDHTPPARWLRACPPCDVRPPAGHWRSRVGAPTGHSACMVAVSV